MKLSDFDYELDKSMIAQRPLEPRDSSRLFYMKRDVNQHYTFLDLPKLLEPDDVIVRNVSRVIPARVMAHKETGGSAEILFYHPCEDGWRCLIKGSNIGPGSKIIVGDDVVEVKSKSPSGLYVVSSRDPMDTIMKYGEMPTPPYIKESLKSNDEYQTVYASSDGSIAAPTAGLHFTKGLLDTISKKGVDIYDITLHVGPGTFLPVRSDHVKEHEMGGEYFEVDEDTAHGITMANQEGRRLILVGTTTVRALESVSSKGKISPYKGWTDLFIYPGYEFQSGMDLLLTNFHLPRSTLLMLISAFAGRERVLEAYREAVERKYRFYSFGDAMLIEGYHA